MTQHTSLPDLERQVPAAPLRRNILPTASPSAQGITSTSPVDQVENLNVDPSLNAALFKEQYSGVNGQVLLLAFNAGKQGVRAIEVPVYRPSRAWIEAQDFVQCAIANDKSEDMELFLEHSRRDIVARLRRDSQYENHQDIWVRSKKAWYDQIPEWQRYIPFWRPIALMERTLELYDRENHLYEVELQAQLIPSLIRERAIQASSRYDSQYRQQYRHSFTPCSGKFDTFGYWHHNEGGTHCLQRLGRTCQTMDVTKIETPIREYDHLHHFLDCFNEPQKARSRSPLCGIMQDGCIMDYSALHDLALPAGTQSVRCPPAKVNGLYLQVGFGLNRWEIDMIISTLVTIIVILVWKLATGDWSIAAGFGSVFVALITLAAMRSQRSDGSLWPLKKRRHNPA